MNMSRLSRLSLLSALVATAATAATAACAPSRSEETSDDAVSSAAFTEPVPVALRYATQYQVGDGNVKWVAVMDVEHRWFSERVTLVYKDATGAWIEREPATLAVVDATHSVLFVDGLPALEPLEFGIHYQAASSGGMGIDGWENDGGHNYLASRLRAPMGRGVDVAVTSITPNRSASGADVVSVDLLVRDLAYDKDVEIVYSTDGWQTKRTAKASYQHGGWGSGEAWRAALALEPDVNDIALAAVTRQAGGEAWDSDGGRNFTCHRDIAHGWTCTGSALVRCADAGCTSPGAR